ncbi:MAG: DUF6110 family protein [Peptococcaceae bacterium]|nr:DUF6110 family protein [Peptococcaceae bacterium]
MFNLNKLALFVGGTVFGSVGFKVLSSREAKDLYTKVTATGLRAKDCVMETVDSVQENVDDIVASAKELNETRAAEEAEAVVEDAEVEDAE